VHGPGTPLVLVTVNKPLVNGVREPSPSYISGDFQQNVNATQPLDVVITGDGKNDSGGRLVVYFNV